MNAYHSRMERYCTIMGQLKTRLLFVEQAFGDLLDDLSNLQDARAMRMEGLAVQLRKVLKLLAYSALLANEATAAKVLPNIGGMQRAKRVIEELSRINPKFFPAPMVIQVLGPGRKHLVDRPGNDALTQAEFAPLFDACSKIVHEANPLAPASTIEIPVPRTVLTRIRNLLEVHVTVISDEQVLVVQMCSWQEPGVMAFDAVAK